MNLFGKKKDKTSDENAGKKVGAADTTRFTAVARRWESPEKSQRRVNIILGLFAATLLLAPLSCTMSLVAMGTAASGGDEAANVNIEGVGETQAFAETMIRDWLKGETPVLPLSTEFPADFGRSGEEVGPVPMEIDSLTWKGATTGQASMQTTGPFTYEVHTFILRTGDLAYDVSATLIVTENGPYLAALPAIEPTIVTAPNAPLNWVNIIGESAPIPNNGESVINEWAAAYVSDNRDELYQLTGDNRDVEYRGIGGYVLNPENGVEIQHSVVGGNLLLVRVQLQVMNASQPAQQFVLDYDIILTNLEALRPSVAAWGPAGTGTTLEAFGNAVSVKPEEIVVTETTLPAENPENEETSEETTNTEEEN